MPIPRKIALLCLLLASATGAQASQVLSLPQALTAAFAQNPELAAAGREIGIADGERRQAGLLPNPELAWEVEDTRRDTSTTTVTLSQPLELGGKRGARLAVAGAGQAIASLTWSASATPCGPMWCRLSTLPCVHRPRWSWLSSRRR